MKHRMMKGAWLLVPVLLVLLGWGANAGAQTDPLLGAVAFDSEAAAEGGASLVWRPGRIEQITEEGVVINDCSYNLAPDVKFYSQSGGELTRLNFYQGTEVKFVFRRGGRTIFSLVKVR